MRLMVNHEKRVMPNLISSETKLLRTHIELLADDAILIGEGSFKDFESTLSSLPPSTSRELIREKILQGNVCFVGQTDRVQVAESGTLPEATFYDLVEVSGAWFTARSEARRATVFGEPSDDAFARMLGGIFAVSKSISVVDRYLTWSLLERAIGENSTRLFWLDRLLQSGAENLHLYLGDVTTDHLKSSHRALATSRAFNLNQAQRLSVLIDYLSRQLDANGFRGTLDIWLARKMPHDRQIRISLEGKRNGILYFGFSKGVDMFETNPIDGSYSLFPKTKMDWHELMNKNSREWPQSSSGNPWKTLVKKDSGQHTITAWLFEED